MNKSGEILSFVLGWRDFYGVELDSVFVLLRSYKSLIFFHINCLIKVFLIIQICLSQCKAAGEG